MKKMTWTKRRSLGETQILFLFLFLTLLLGKRWHKMQIYPQKKVLKKNSKTYFCFTFFFNSIFFLSCIFYLSFLYIGNSIILILAFVDNILVRHKCSCNCKSNTTFFCYLIIRKKRNLKKINKNDKHQINIV